MATVVTAWEKAGFFNEKINIELALNHLDTHINNMAAIFKDYSTEELLDKPGPDKWSKQEILGHLIDSAINNLKRFTEIQFLPQPYQVISYRQNELVVVNYYQELPLVHLLDLWKILNQQISYVVQNIAPEKLDYPVDPQYDNGEMKSLGWIICDYVAHLEHHLRQVTGKE
jgi:subtilase family serine protease